MNKDLIELKTADPAQKCCFCGRHEINDIEWGVMYKLNSVVLHYFCMLFSSGLNQCGQDHEGILGFLSKDILNEVRRGKRLKCKWCRREGATVGCSVKTCKASFHYTCGYENGSLSQFQGNFASYCKTHRPSKRIIPKATDKVCPICITEVEQDLHAVWPPCCGKSVFHRKCIMHAAKEAGYFFKCPLCNDNKKFITAMKDNGVFVPEQDAAWETVPGAFEEHVERYSTCDAVECLCPNGRNYDHKDKAEKAWKIVRCCGCGSSATHFRCSSLEELKWKCELCRLVLQDHPAGAPPVEDDEEQSDDYSDSDDEKDDGDSSEESEEEHIIKKHVKHVRNVIESSDEYDSEENGPSEDEAQNTVEPMQTLEPAKNTSLSECFKEPMNLCESKSSSRRSRRVTRTETGFNLPGTSTRNTSSSDLSTKVPKLGPVKSPESSVGNENHTSAMDVDQTHDSPVKSRVSMAAVRDDSLKEVPRNILRSISASSPVDVMKLPRIPKIRPEANRPFCDERKSALDEGRSPAKKLHQSNLKSWILPDRATTSPIKPNPVSRSAWNPTFDFPRVVSKVEQPDRPSFTVPTSAPTSQAPSAPTDIQKRLMNIATSSVIAPSANVQNTLPPIHTQTQPRAIEIMEIDEDEPYEDDMMDFANSSGTAGTSEAVSKAATVPVENLEDSDDDCVIVVKKPPPKPVEVLTIDSDSDDEVIYEDTVKNEIPKSSAFVSMVERSKNSEVKIEEENIARDVVDISDDEEDESEIQVTAVVTKSVSPHDSPPMAFETPAFGGTAKYPSWSVRPRISGSASRTNMEDGESDQLPAAGSSEPSALAQSPGSSGRAEVEEPQKRVRLS